MDYKKLIESAKNSGITDIEVYVSSSSSTTISIFNGELEKNQVQDSKGISVRAIYKDKMAYLAIENDNEDLNFIINTLKDNASSLTTLEEFEIFGGSDEYPEINRVDGGFEKVPMSEKVKLVKGLEREVKAVDPRIKFVPYCRYVESSETIELINSKGLELSKTTSYAYLVAQAIAKENDESQSSHDFDIKLKYDELDPKTLALKIAKETIEKLNAKPVPSKVYPIVFNNKAMSELFGVFTSIFSGEAAIKKLTPLLGKEGQKIFSEKVTIVDDPLFPDSINAQPFDDEGVACYKKEVVKDGVFKTLLHNLKTARYFKTTSTGNGFKAARSGAVGVSGSNLYIASGEKTYDELIESISEGLLITALAGLHAGANSITGDFSAQASGFLIIDGKISRPVNLIVVSGNFIKILNDVEDLGNDFKMFYTNVGCPSIKFTGLPVSGK